MPTTRPPRADVAALFPRVADLALSTTRLHPRCSLDLPPSASKLGGEVLWPAAEPWPICSDPVYGPESPMCVRSREPHPYVPVLQLRADEYPELGFPKGRDLFQLLWCPNDHVANYHPLPDPICRLSWRREADVTDPLKRAPAPTVFQKEFVPHFCSLHPERVLEYPSTDELPADVRADIWGWEEAQGHPLYQYELSTAPGTKIGGYVDWIQESAVPVCGAGHPMEYLLTIASAEFDGGSWERWCPIEEGQIWDRPWQEWRPIVEPSGLMLGDLGSAYVFVCRRCPHWPNATVFQCS